MPFWTEFYEGRAEKVAARLERQVAREAGLAEPVHCEWAQQRPTLPAMALFLAPLNDEPSHVYLLRFPRNDGEVVVEVHVDGDRATPLAVYLMGPTRFKPRVHTIYCPGVVKGKFPEGDEDDIARLKATPGLSRLLRKCTNTAYGGVLNFSTELHIEPNEHGGEVIAVRMPAEKWLFFNEVGVRPFLRLLDLLDALGGASNAL